MARQKQYTVVYIFSSSFELQNELCRYLNCKYQKIECFEHGKSDAMYANDFEESFLAKSNHA